MAFWTQPASRVVGEGMHNHIEEKEQALIAVIFLGVEWVGRCAAGSVLYVVVQDRADPRKGYGVSSWYSVCMWMTRDASLVVARQ